MLHKQTGQAMVLVLVVLGVGTATIVPTLSYAGTALKAQQIMQRAVLQEYAVDAAVEDGIWRLKNNVDGMKDQLTLANPSQTYELTVNGVSVSVTAQLPPALPDSDHSNPPGNPERLFAYIERSPKWLPHGGGTFAYSVWVVPVDSGGISWGREMRAALPPGFSYVPGSSVWTRTDGGAVALADPTTQVISGTTWHIWNIPNDYERIGKPPDTATLAFSASVGALDGGLYYSKAKVLYAGQGQEDPDQFTVGNTAPVWVGAYQVGATADLAQADSFLVFTQSGGIRMFNWAMS